MEIELDNFINMISPILRNTKEEVTEYENSDFNLTLYKEHICENCDLYSLVVSDDKDKTLGVLFIEGFNHHVLMEDKKVLAIDFQASEDRKEKGINRKFYKFFDKNKDKIYSILSKDN